MKMEEKANVKIYSEKSKKNVTWKTVSSYCFILPFPQTAHVLNGVLLIAADFNSQLASVETKLL